MESQSQGELIYFPISQILTYNTLADDEFPDISDLLRPYAKVATTAQANISASSIPAHLSRLSIRATTFSGKTIILKRKPRRFGVLSTVSPSDVSFNHVYHIDFC